MLYFVFVFFSSRFVLQTHISSSQTTVENIDDVVNFLKEFNIEAAEMCNRVANNEWKYATNATEYNKRRVKEQQSVATKFECLSWKRATSFSNYAISNSNVKRQLQRIIKQGKCGLSDEKYAEINSLIQQMTDNYKHARVCPYRGTQSEVVNQSTQMGENIGVVPIAHNESIPSPSSASSSASSSQLENYVTHTYTGYCDLSIDNDIPRIMEQSRNEAELKYIWSAWHEKTGPPNRNNFMRYIDLANQAATAHGFSDAGEQMRSQYEDPEMYFTVQDVWAQIQPLYRQLFTFVRKGLIRQYGEKIIRPDGPIPAHLLGNMWAQNWKHIMDIVKHRYSETPDVTAEMVRQGYTPLRIFQKAEEFFTSLGMAPMSPEFWRNSILQQQSNDRSPKCTASAWDFCNNFDFRVKQCTQITLDDFINTHYEISHVQYYMLYANQPFVYREGPNPAFHESIGMKLAKKYQII